MARVKCVMMQRNETLLLDAWFRHYGDLFGFENLVVFDNGSSDPTVREILAANERLGATVFRDFTRGVDFHCKGEYVVRVIRHWDETEDYDFALPLDCDEFISVYTESGLDCSREAIHAHFDELAGEQRVLKLDYCLMNVPGRPGCFTSRLFPKRFLASGTVDYIDHGFHAITSGKQPGERETRFTYLHMHNKPFKNLIEHARQKLKPFVDVDDPVALRTFSGCGIHLVDYLFMTEQDYFARYEQGSFLRLPGVANHFRNLGIRDAFFDADRQMEPAEPPDGAGVLELVAGLPEKLTLFDAQMYLLLNPDVAAAGLPALQHFATFGLAEGRRITDLPPDEARRQAEETYRTFCTA